MLDIEINWFLVNLGIFSILFISLYFILFKPLVGVITKRKDHVKDSLDSAKSMAEEKEDMLSQIDAALVEARNKTRTIVDDLSKEGAAVQQKSLDAAKKEAADINSKAKENIEAEVKKARESLRGKIDSFCKIIIEKMVGA